MALQIKDTLGTNGQGNALLITDATGIYNGSNTGGFGTPNPETSDVTSDECIIIVPNSSTYLATGNSYTFNTFGTFPTTDQTLEYSIQSYSLGQSSGEILATGVYKLTRNVGVGASNYGYTNSYLVIPRIEQAVYQLLLSGSCCDCRDYTYLNDMLTLVKLAFSYGEINKSLCELRALSNALLSLGKTNL